jgi:anti-sigma regulatory factor (Ser/Thr protein kinase)
MLATAGDRSLGAPPSPEAATGVRPAVSLELAGGPQAALIARRALERLGDQVSPELLDDMRLLVTELVTNSVRHAGTGSGASLQLEVAMKGDLVRIEVGDDGPGFAATPRPAADQASGWGLYLVDRLADRWGVTALEGGTRVWLELDRGGYSRRAA